jgi:hypothetical protein
MKTRLTTRLLSAAASLCVTVMVLSAVVSLFQPAEPGAEVASVSAVASSTQAH